MEICVAKRVVWVLFLSNRLIHDMFSFLELSVMPKPTLAYQNHMINTINNVHICQNTDIFIIDRSRIVWTPIM